MNSGRPYWCALAILFVIVAACQNAPKTGTDNPAAITAAIRPISGDYLQLVSKLNALPAGTHVFVYEDYVRLIPKKLSAHVLVNRKLPNGGFQVPDKRINPIEVRFLLAPRQGVISDVMCFGDPPLWKPIMSFSTNKTEVLLFERAAPVETQVEPSLSAAQFHAQLKQMEKAPGSSAAPGGREHRGGFLIDRYAVSHAQYAYFLNDIGIAYDEANVYYSIKDAYSKIVFLGGQYRIYRGTARYPVFNVSYYGAKAFCEHYGKRLPTYDEWRRALGYWKDSREFPWGAARDFERRANFVGAQDGYPLWAPVDAFPAGQSPSGVFNMAGNVYEWLDGTVLVGGAWDYPPEPYGRVSHADGNLPVARNLHDGFRCVADRNVRD